MENRGNLLAGLLLPERLGYYQSILSQDLAIPRVAVDVSGTRQDGLVPRQELLGGPSFYIQQI